MTTAGTIREAVRQKDRRLTAAVAAMIARVALAVLVFLLGLFGFSQTHGPGEAGGLMGDLGNTIQLIGGRLPAALEGRSLPISLTLARIGLPLVTSWATLSLIWLRMRNPVRAAMIRWRGDHLVVAGDATLAAQVTLAERRARRPVLVWTDDVSPAWIGAAADAGAPNVVGGFSAGAPPKGLGFAKARAVLLAGPDGAANASAASAVLRAVVERASSEPLMVIARVDDGDLRGALEARLSGGDRKLAQLRFASAPDIGARQLFLSHAADQFQRGRGEQPGVLFLGFGQVAQAFALRLLAGAHHRGGVARGLAVLAPDAIEQERVFRARHPGAFALSTIRFMEARVDEPALVAEALREAFPDGEGADCVLVDLATSERSLSVALAADAAFTRAQQVAPPIYVVGVDRLPDGVGALLRPIGGPAALADPELLLQDRLDGLARSIHDFYLESRLAEGGAMGSRNSMQEWEDLPEEIRNDNRLIADCYTLKLRDLGARLEPGRGDGFRLEADELEALARAEHDRWMAAKLLAGWVHGDTRDDLAKRHPDIVPYDALSEPIKEIDREQIRVMGRVLVAADQRPVREHLIAVEAPASFDDDAWTQISAALARSRPDASPAVLIEFDDAGSRRLATSAVRSGASFQLILTRPADDTLAALDGGARAEAVALLAGADRVFALSGEAWPEAARAAYARERAQARLPAGTTILDRAEPAAP